MVYVQQKRKALDWLLSLFLFALLLGADQGSKFLAVRYLKGGTAVKLLPGIFELTYLENFGAGFGILQNNRYALLAFSAVLFLLILAVVIKIPGYDRYRGLRILLIVLEAGNVGNMIDRFLNGYVIDFFYFRLIDFPVFNVADIWITCSVILMLLITLFTYSEEEIAILWKSLKG